MLHVVYANLIPPKLGYFICDIIYNVMLIFFIPK